VMKDVMKKVGGDKGNSPLLVGEGQNVKDVPGLYKGAKGRVPGGFGADTVI
jgi:hypothetical protein